jgi:hypothetical protein
MSGRYIDLRELSVDGMVTGDSAKERERETHGEKDGHNNAEVHEALERLTPFVQESVHPAVCPRAEVNERGGAS